MNRYLIYTVIAILIAVSFSCSTTKRLGEDQILYTGVRRTTVASMSGDDLPSYVNSEVRDALNVRPNNPLYSPYIRTPIPTGLWAWNYLHTEKTHGLRHWLYSRLAKEPVLIADVQADLRMKMVEDILDNMGYFHSDANYEVVHQRNPKKARMRYDIRVADPWFYGTVEYPEPGHRVTNMVNSLQATSGIRTGNQYNIDSLTNERVRITNHLRNHGFYYFRPEYIEYLGDTTRAEHAVDVRMKFINGVPLAAMKPYVTGNMTIRINNSEPGKLDSLEYNGIKVVYQTPKKLRDRVLFKLLTFHPGDSVVLDDINQTLTNFSRLGVFKLVNLEVTPIDSLAGLKRDSIDMVITASFDMPLEADIGVEFSTKSSSFIGPGLMFGVKHNNIFHGGEVLSVKLNGSYEWQTGNTSSQANATAVNSYEFGLTGSLTFPRLLMPRFIRRPSERFASRTSFQLGGNLLNRPKFFTMLSTNMSMTYDFQTTPTKRHSLTLFRFVYNDLLRTTEAFDNTLNENRAIAQSFRNSLIPSASYTFTYDRTKRKTSRLVWQSTFTTAGNLFWLGGEVLGKSGEKKVFGNTFSQFIKGTTELRNFFRAGDNSTIVTRISLGVGYAYGNSEVMPYSEQFYVGGANSIRAFTIRSIGPGSYRADENDKYGYFDQAGDIKFEANVEYRFRMLGDLHGAIFVDAGNIWLMKKDEARPGGQFKLKKFGEQLALGTGFGLRYDLTFLVIRADLGIGIHTPYKNPDRSGYYNISSFKDGLGFHLAVGYPF